MYIVGFYSKLSFLVGDYCLTALAGPPDRNTPSEENMIEVYRTEAHRLNVVFSETAFNYAKAVSCLRLISIIRVSYKPATVFLGASDHAYCCWKWCWYICNVSSYICVSVCVCVSLHNKLHNLVSDIVGSCLHDG